MNILIVKLSAIGDVVQTLPALEALKKRFPDSRITWLVEEAASGILEGHPLIDRLLVSRRKTWFSMLGSPFTFASGMKGIIRFIRDLRRTPFDMAIDFQGLLKSGILMGLARADRKIGFDRTREFSYLFLNERLPAYDIEKHALERYLDVARYLGAVDPSASCTLPIGAELAAMEERLKKTASGRPLAVLNPVARWKTKLWPEKNFAALADRLIREKNAVVVFTGSSGDRVTIDRILSLMAEKGALNWAGATTLKELAALASLADVFITTDTGPMHLAAAAGARIVALFGPTAPWRTGPYGPSHRVVRTGVECSPCFQRRQCGRSIMCMRGITVEDVMKTVA